MKFLLIFFGGQGLVGWVWGVCLVSWIGSGLGVFLGFGVLVGVAKPLRLIMWTSLSIFTKICWFLFGCGFVGFLYGFGFKSFWFSGFTMKASLGVFIWVFFVGLLFLFGVGIFGLGGVVGAGLGLLVAGSLVPPATSGLGFVSGTFGLGFGFAGSSVPQLLVG